MDSSGATIKLFQLYDGIPHGHSHSHISTCSAAHGGRPILLLRIISFSSSEAGGTEAVSANDIRRRRRRCTATKCSCLFWSTSSELFLACMLREKRKNENETSHHHRIFHSISLVSTSFSSPHISTTNNFFSNLSWDRSIGIGKQTQWQAMERKGNNQLVTLMLKDNTIRATLCKTINYYRHYLTKSIMVVHTEFEVNSIIPVAALCYRLFCLSFIFCNYIYFHCYCLSRNWILQCALVLIYIMIINMAFQVVL